MRAVVEGAQTREQALASYDAFSEEHEWKFKWMLRNQRWIGQLTNTPILTALLRVLDNQRFIDWSFGHYRTITPPEFALAGRARGRAAPGPAATVADAA